MKKFIKTNLKTILVACATAIICISGTVFAALQYQASQVEYKDGKSVETALNELYSKTSNITNQNVYFAENNGNNVASKNTSLNLNKGKYIVFICYTRAWLQADLRTDRNTTFDESDLMEISSQGNNTNILSLKGFRRRQAASDLADGICYQYDSLFTRTYFVDVKENSDIITHNYTSIDQNSVPLLINMYAVKL